MADGYDATAVIAVSAAFSVLVSAVLVFRYIARYTTQDDFGVLDDYFFLVAFLLVWACAGTNFATALSYSSAARTSLATVQDRTRLENQLIACQYCWAFAVTSAKVAILLFYRRLFDPWAPRAVFTILALLAAFLLSAIAVIAANKGRSISANVGLGAVNTFLGLLVLAIPLSMIWSLSMRTRRKWIKTFWYCMGWIALPFSIARFACFEGGDMQLSQQKDLSLILCWSIVEPSLWLIAGSLPTVRQLWRQRRYRSELRAAAQTGNASSNNITFGIPPDTERDADLTALPAIPANVVYHTLHGRRGWRPPTVRSLQAVFEMPTRRTPEPLADNGTVRDTSVMTRQGSARTHAGALVDNGTIRETPFMTRQNSVRTDLGMYTHWRQEDDDDGNDTQYA